MWARGIDVQQVSLVINYDLPAYVVISSDSIDFLWLYAGTVKTISTVLVVPVDLEGKVLQLMYVNDLCQY